MERFRRGGMVEAAAVVMVASGEEGCGGDGGRVGSTLASHAVTQRDMCPLSLTRPTRSSDATALLLLLLCPQHSLFQAYRNGSFASTA